MTLWKINCMEDEYPGMWQNWFKHQAAAVGWPPESGYALDGGSKGGRYWTQTSNAIKSIERGDFVVVSLKNHRVGRIGEVVGKAIQDDEWDPLVPPNSDKPYGEMGRQIHLRWDLTIGPDSRDDVVRLPEGARFTMGELRSAVSQIRSLEISELKAAMNDESNWIGLLSQFSYERALSNYVGTYPHRLEDGLLPHPSKSVREHVFDDGRRSDVLLIDRDERPVVVECKQHQPSKADLKQLRHYMDRLEAETERCPRGILVHGGARKLRKPILKAAEQDPPVEIVQYRVEVDFLPST